MYTHTHTYTHTCACIHICAYIHAQRHIYSNVIEELLNKGYYVSINTSKDICRIKITWLSPEDKADIKYQMEIIAKHTTTF